jgi:hypothetical protein
MADTNITELRPGPVNDPTNALRQRRHRKRKARSTVTARAPRAQNAHVEKPNDFKSDVTVSVGRWNEIALRRHIRIAESVLKAGIDIFAASNINGTYLLTPETCCQRERHRTWRIY